MSYQNGTVARMIHDYVALEKRVRDLETRLAEHDTVVKRAFEPVEAAPREENCCQAPTQHVKLKTAPASLPDANRNQTFAENTGQRPRVFGDATPKDGELPEDVTVQVEPYGGDMLTVTLTHAASGVRVKSMPFVVERDAHKSAWRLFRVAYNEYSRLKELDAAASKMWFTLEDYKRLRRATDCNVKAVYEALHVAKNYDEALGWLLTHGGHLK